MTKPNPTKKIFLSCDWGTSSFRLKLVHLQSGDIIESLATDYGIKKAHSEWQIQNGEIDREAFFLSYLKENIARFESDTENVPLIISGMASSNLGMKELPYAALPMDFDPSQLKTYTRKADRAFPHTLMLISGIKTKNDVIRGEETQVFGMADKLEDDEDAVIILPGTHSKHIIIRNKRIVDFKTYITGELFQLLSKHSILKDSLATAIEDLDMAAFKNGIQESQKENFLHSIFKIRAGDILHKTDKIENTAFLSGLLIGQEVQVLKNLKIKQLYLAGEGRLKKLYSAAIESTVLSDKEAEHLTMKGHQYILNHYQKSNL